MSAACGEAFRFENLFAPTTIEDFFAASYERAPLHVELNGEQRFARLAGDVDPFRLVREQKLSWGEVSLARSDIQPSHCPYTTQDPSEATVRSAYDEGYTVVINDLQLRSSSVAQLCREFERAFFCRANVNLYQTGAGQRGLATHYDDDDVFIFQLIGSKHWRTFPDRKRLPLGRGDYQNSEDWGKPDNRLLRAGDMLYLPRGTPHDAQSADEASLHLTVSINVVRWAELASEVIYQLAAEEGDLRRSVPAGFLRFGERPAGMRVPPLLEKLSPDPAVWGAALQRIQARIVGSAPRLGSEPVVLHPISPEQRFEIAPDQLWGSVDRDGEALVQAIDATFAFSGDLKAISGRLKEKHSIAAKDLPRDIALNAWSGIAREMEAAGFLVRSPAHNVQKAKPVRK